MKKIINNYSHIKKFTKNNLRFDFDNLLFSINRDIKLYKSKLKWLQEELIISKGLIALANDELIQISDTNQKEKAVLIDDIYFFKNEIIRLTSDKNKQREVLRECLLIKKHIVDLKHSLKIYQNNINSMNELIDQYNKSIETGSIYINNNSLSALESYKDNILSIITKRQLLGNVINDNDISTTYLYEQLNNLNVIDKYYNCNKEKVEVVEGYHNDLIDTYISPDINDFIFKTYEQKENNKENYNLKLVITEDVNDFVCNSYPDYIPAKKKIKKVKKASRWQKIKKSLRKNIQKVLTCLLVGVTMLFGTQIIALDGNLVNSKVSNHQSNDIISTIDEVTDSSSINTNDIMSTIDEAIASSEINMKDTNKQIVEDAKFDDNGLSDIDIGDSVDVNSDIYINANDAIKEENAMTSYYSTDDERSISVIAYSNEDFSDYITVTKDNKDKIKELEKLKYDVVAYCVSNDSQNIEYEGWHNIEDIKVKRY